jgi:beta-mannosidase
LYFSGKLVSDESKQLAIAAASSTLLSSANDADLLKGADPAKVFAVYDLVQDGKVISRNEVFFAPMKDAQLPPPKVDMTWASAGNGTALTLSSQVLARHVGLTFGNLDAHASDNYFDLLPGESVTVVIESKSTAAELQKATKLTTLTDAFLQEHAR